MNLWSPPTTSQTYVSIGPTLHRNNGMTTCLYVYPRATFVYGLGYGEYCTPTPRPLTLTPELPRQPKRDRLTSATPRISSLPSHQDVAFLVSYTAISFHSSTWLVVPYSLSHLVACPLSECRTCSPFSPSTVAQLLCDCCYACLLYTSPSPRD